MASQTSTHWVHLAPNLNSVYQQLFVKGTRIRARVIYGMHVNAEEPMAPDEIAAEFGLPVEAVKEAIVYCQSNPPEIVEDFRREEARMEATGMNDPSYRNHGMPKLPTAEQIAQLEDA